MDKALPVSEQPTAPEALAGMGPGTYSQLDGPLRLVIKQTIHPDGVSEMIGRSGERGSGISVLAARHDDDDTNKRWGHH